MRDGFYADAHRALLYARMMRELAPSLGNLRLCLLLAACPSVFISFALPLRAVELGASATEVGALFSVFTAALLLVRPIVGLGLDRFGRRPFLFVALGAYVTTNIAFAAAEGLGGLFAARALHGIAMATLLLTADAMTADAAGPETRSAAMGGNMQSSARGGMLGATIGFSLVGAIPSLAWPLSFAVFALVALVALAVPARRIPETAVAAPQPASAGPATYRPSPPFIRLVLLVALVAFAAALIQPLYLVYLQGRFDLELRALAMVFLPVGLAYALLPARIGRFTGGWPRRRAMAVGLVSAGVAYLAIPQFEWLLAMIVLFVIAAIGSALGELTRSAWVADLTPADATGRAYGLIELAAGLGGVIGPLAGGALYDRVSQESVFVAGGSLLLMAGAISALAIDARRR